MSFVTMISEAEATPQLKPLYEELKGAWNFVPNFWLAQGHRPDLIRAQKDFYDGVFTTGELPQTLKEQIGLVVAGINTSSYCIAIHMEILRNLGIEKPMARKLATDWEHAPVEPKVMELFRFAAKLTKNPGEMTKADVDTLRKVGWDDGAIYETVLTASVMGLFNRISLGLGLVADF
jgi:uncharacterized peroxidase-related enzyme